MTERGEAFKRYHIDFSVNFWFALYVRSGFEEKVSMKLSNEGFTNFMPIVNVYAPNGKGKGSTELVFPNLVFVYVHKHEIENFKHYKNVIDYWYWLNKPAIFDSHSIEILRSFLLKNQIVDKERIPVEFERSATISYENKLNVGLHSVLQLPCLGYRIIGKTLGGFVNISQSSWKGQVLNESSIIRLE